MQSSRYEVSLGTSPASVKIVNSPAFQELLRTKPPRGTSGRGRWLLDMLSRSPELSYSQLTSDEPPNNSANVIDEEIDALWDSIPSPKTATLLQSRRIPAEEHSGTNGNDSFDELLPRTTKETCAAFPAATNSPDLGPCNLRMCSPELGSDDIQMYVNRHEQKISY